MNQTAFVAGALLSTIAILSPLAGFRGVEGKKGEGAGRGGWKEGEEKGEDGKRGKKESERGQVRRKAEGREMERSSEPPLFILQFNRCL